jgi:prepilin-type N-terminal cleavage/methylation domain-containing protein
VIVAGTNFASWRRGHTLVEVAVAVAIIGVLAGIGWGLMSRQLPTYRLMRAGRLLQTDLQQLRTLSVATNREARLRLVESDAELDAWADGVGRWELQLGNRSSGSTVWDTLPPDDDGLVDNGQGIHDISPVGNQAAPGVSLAAPPHLEGPGLGNEDCIVFSPRGWVSNPAGDFVDGYIALQLLNKRALRDGRTEQVRVRVPRSGLAHLDRGYTSGLADGAVAAPEASAR